mmetsp:Transcript_37914/g.58981  ORF Transcript_37914/g.58981 Transcript_37914/m.58981 type:complete len:216 (-) Transcript_37914:385-1032(-)
MELLLRTRLAMESLRLSVSVYVGGRRVVEHSQLVFFPRTSSLANGACIADDSRSTVFQRIEDNGMFCSLHVVILGLGSDTLTAYHVLILYRVHASDGGLRQRCRNWRRHGWGIQEVVCNTRRHDVFIILGDFWWRRLVRDSETAGGRFSRLQLDVRHVYLLRRLWCVKRSDRGFRGTRFRVQQIRQGLNSPRRAEQNGSLNPGDARHVRRHAQRR